MFKSEYVFIKNIQVKLNKMLIENSKSSPCNNMCHNISENQLLMNRFFPLLIIIEKFRMLKKI